MESSPRFRNTNSWTEDNSIYPSNHVSSTPTPEPAASPAGSVKLRLMCSNGGHIVPRPHDKSLCYVGGETHMIVVDRHITLVNLTHRISKTFLRSSSSGTASFTLKYQLPSEDLDSLISVTTDEDFENMIEEYERLHSFSRIRLFVFPTNPESVSSIGSLLENSIKSEDWFLNALNGTNSGFSDTSSVNCLLDLDGEISPPEKKDVHLILDSPLMETTSSFGSASSTPSIAKFPPHSVNTDDQTKVIGGGLEEHFSQMSVKQGYYKHQDDGGFVAVPAPAVVSGSPLSSATKIQEHSDTFSSYHQQFQQKQSPGLDLSSLDSGLSDCTITDQSSPVILIQSSINNNQAYDPTETPDQNTGIQIQQQQIQNSSYLLSSPTTQINTKHPQLHHQQLQFIRTSVPPLQYIHHHHHPPTDQQNLVYYIPAQGYNYPLQQPNQGTPKSVIQAGVYRTTNSGGPQLFRVLSDRYNQPHYNGYSQDR